MALTTSPPKRQQVIDEIIASINRGTLPPGTRLATVRDMSNHFDVSLSVIQTALHELVQEGMVECRGASGFYVKGIPAPAAVPVADKPEANPAEGQVFLSCYHHADLVWRHTYEEYDAIRERQLQLLLRYFAEYPAFRFFIDQSEVLRRYIDKHPEHLEPLRAAVTAGQLELGGCLSIPDLNLCGGESLVRNLLAGKKYYRDVFNTEIETASMCDAFGMCAQLPQVLSKCGFKWLLPGRLPKFPDTLPNYKPFNWRGLDGTALPVVPPEGFAGHFGYDFNVPTTMPESVRLAQSITNLKLLNGNVMALYLTEEEFIEEDLFWILEAANRQGGKLVEFGRLDDFARKLNPAELPVINGEFNPTFTGCYTTRIQNKQLIRRAENLIMDAEMLDAISNSASDFAPLWQELFLAQFHDAACGCVTDAAAEGILAKLHTVIAGSEKIIADNMARISGAGLTVFNPNHCHSPQLISGPLPPAGCDAQQDGGNWFWTAELPPCGIRSFEPAKVKNTVKTIGPKFKTDHFEADFSDGLPVIRSRENDCQVLGKQNFGEILFRPDYGSMWAETLQGGNLGIEHQEIEVVQVESGPVFIKAVLRGKVKPGKPDAAGNLGAYWPGFGELSFEQEYIFPQHLDYFKMKLTLNWQGCNTKISIRFPIELKEKKTTALYEVPFGALERRPYFEVPYEYEENMQKLNPNDYQTAKGDWPALNWVDYSDHRGGLAVANTGTPGHQLVGENILVSLLRSGTLRADGGMVPQAGSYDNGTQVYEFAFRPHRAGEQHKAFELGRLLNHPPRVVFKEKGKAAPTQSWLHWNAKQVALSTLHRSGDGWLVRLYETLGSSALINLKSDLGKFELFETAMDGENPVKISAEKIKFRPFEIKTFKVVHK